MMIIICMLLLLFDVLSGIYMVSRLSVKKGVFIVLSLTAAVLMLMISGCMYIAIILLTVPAFVIYGETEKRLQEEKDENEDLEQEENPDEKRSDGI